MDEDAKRILEFNDEKLGRFLFGENAETGSIPRAGLDRRFYFGDWKCGLAVALNPPARLIPSPLEAGRLYSL